MSLCGLSVLSVPLWFGWVGGIPNSEFLIPHSEFRIPNSEFPLQYPAAIPSLRDSEAPARTPVAASRRIAW